jgi:hypothetical protein
MCCLQIYIENVQKRITVAVPRQFRPTAMHMQQQQLAVLGLPCADKVPARITLTVAPAVLCVLFQAHRQAEIVHRPHR